MDITALAPAWGLEVESHLLRDRLRVLRAPTDDRGRRGGGWGAGRRRACSPRFCRRRAGGTNGVLGVGTNPSGSAAGVTGRAPGVHFVLAIGDPARGDRIGRRELVAFLEAP